MTTQGTKKTRGSRFFTPDPQAPERYCDHQNCTEDAGFRAPKGRNPQDGYFWFCLDHVRQYNANWNYFKDMTPAQMDAYIKNGAVWDRPTKPIDEGRFSARMKDTLDREFDELLRGRARAKAAPALSVEIRRALKTLELKWPVDEDTLKKTYRERARASHPDLNPERRVEAQEEFKAISLAYRTLSALIRKTST